MFGIIIGIFVGFAIVWLIFTLWDYIASVNPYDIDETDATDDPIFEAIKCHNCGCYEYEVLYVDPLFNRGKYGRCTTCGWTFDLDED